MNTFDLAWMATYALLLLLLGLAVGPKAVLAGLLPLLTNLRQRRPPPGPPQIEGSTDKDPPTT